MDVSEETNLESIHICYQANRRSNGGINDERLGSYNLQERKLSL